MMGFFPEPAPCADDVSRLVPDATSGHDDTVSWLPRCKRSNGAIARRRTLAKLLIGLVIGSGLPQSALAPSASAHDRIDESASMARVLGMVDKPAEWAGVPLVEQEPATLALIEGDLAGLVPAREPAGRDVLRFGEMTVPREIAETILRAADATSVDPVYMMALADKESSFSTHVKSSSSSAEGLFQFLSGTWLELIRTYGARYGFEAEAAAVTGRGGAITIADETTRSRVLRLRRDPYVAALMAGELIKRDRSRIEQRIGRELKTSELYLAHFLGTSSAGRFLALNAEKPDQVAKQVFRAAARANRSLFTEKAGKSRRALTVAELRDRLGDMIDRRLTRYEGVAALVSGQEVRSAAEGQAVEAQGAEIQDATLLVPQPIPRVQVTEAVPAQ